jgi:hypothetical protein
MKKRLIAVFICVCVLVSAGSAAQVVLSDQELTVNGEFVNCEKYNIGGSNYFKLRDLAYCLNGTDSAFSVSYDSAANCVAINSGAFYLSNGSELSAGEDKSATAIPSLQTILINGKKSAGISVYNIGGNNYFKLRDLGDALGFDVSYDEKTRVMSVTSREADLSGREVLDSEQIFAKCSPAVFYIEVFDYDGYPLGSGSGFFIDSEGTAVTNYHVIANASSAFVTVVDNGNGNGGNHEVVGVYDYSAEQDWAVIKVSGSGYSWLRPGEESTVVGGAPVYAIGSPLGLQNSITQGIISNPSRADLGVEYIQTSAAISPGSSGGALINKYGDVIGITSGSFEGGQSLNLAVPMRYLCGAGGAEAVALERFYDSHAGMLILDEYEVVLDLNIGYEYPIYATAHGPNGQSIHLGYFIEDQTVVSCSWGEWYGDDIALFISPVSVGTAEISVYLYSDEEEILDEQTLLVSVCEGSIELSEYLITVDEGASAEITVTAGLVDPMFDTFTVEYYIYDPSVVNCSWGKWQDDKTIPLTVTALAPGETTVEVRVLNERKQCIVYEMLEVTVAAG